MIFVMITIPIQIFFSIHKNQSDTLHIAYLEWQKTLEVGFSFSTSLKQCVKYPIVIREFIYYEISSILIESRSWI